MYWESKRQLANCIALLIDTSKITPEIKISDLITIAKQSVLDAGGSQENGALSILNTSGYNLIVSKNGLLHGSHAYSKNKFNQVKDKYKINLEIFTSIGDILKKAVPINEQNTDGSDSKISDLGLIVFMGCAIKNNQIVPILIIARQLANTTTGIVETIYTLKSINAKTPNIGTIGLLPTSSSTRRLMRVNIQNLLNEVKNGFPDYYS